ncbi:MAG: sulfatase-like hydrolase/transferase [Oligoflexia bacterium]|nr:sulfatase-like hydrolase/transferase [Oligoflexia bacterium]
MGTRKSVAPSFVLLMQVLVLVPAQVFLSNGGEFSHGYLNILGSVAWTVWACLTLVVFIAALLPLRLQIVLHTLLMSTVLGVYVQSQVLVWDYGQFDGTPIAWSDFCSRGALDILVWAGIFVLLLCFRAWCATNSSRILTLVVALHCVAILPVLKSNYALLLRESPSVKLQAITDFSPQKNVVLVVLDAMQGPAFQKLLDQEPSLQDSFKDFIFFRNVTSSFPSTLPSVPSFLTGQAYDGKKPLRRYFEEDVRETSLPTQLEKNGVKARIATIPGFCPYFASGVCGETRRYPLLGRPDGAEREFLELIDYTLFRISPQFIKQQVYHDEAWLLQRLDRQSRSMARTVDDGVAFAKEFVAQASANSPTPTFKMLHFLFPHPPIRLDAECNLLPRNEKLRPETYLRQARCGLKVALDIVETLRRLEIYEQSTIIIAADHGTRLDFGTNTAELLKSRKLTQISRALPLLLIKPAGHQGKLSVNEAAVELADLPRTVADAFQLPISFPGENVFSVRPDASRQRVFRDFSFRWAKWDEVGESDEFSSVPTYIIDGNACDAGAWRRAPWRSYVLDLTVLLCSILSGRVTEKLIE